MNIETQQKILTTLESGKQLSFQFSFPDKKRMKQINSIFAKILGKMDRIFLLETIITILRECVLNAAKANSKRLFFELNDTNIKDPASYSKLMNSFKANVIGNFDTIKEELEESDYKINFKVKNENNDLKITIENNVPILPAESARINARIASAKKYEDFTQAYEEMYDDTEGAGLGIILTILLLKNCGIAPENFSLSTDAVNTYTHLKIPHELKPSSVTTQLKNQIINELEMLPTLPNAISELLQLCDNPEVSIDFFVNKLNQDPSLAADVLKTANSAAFLSMTRIEDLHQALMRIGLKNLKNLLMAVSTQKILEKRYKSFEKIWEHCMKVAFYSRQIATRLKYNLKVENIAICALLHDIGKIVLLSINNNLTTWIADFMKNRKMRTSTILEEVSLGISHSLIGKLVAEKWNFPDYVTESIQFHHSPLSASDDKRDIVDMVYLGNTMCGLETRKYEFTYIEEEVLEKYNIKDENTFNDLHQEIKSMYETNKET